MNNADSLCELCGEPMPPSEEMFKYHGYSGPCPKSPARREQPAQGELPAQNVAPPQEISTLEVCRRQLQNIIYCCNQQPPILVNSIRVYAETALYRVMEDIVRPAEQPAQGEPRKERQNDRH